MLLNSKLKDFINTISLDLIHLDCEYLIKGDNRLEDYNKYIK